MTHPVDRALHLWSHPVPSGDAALASFRTVYADPLVVNGLPAPLGELVGRARMLQTALDGLAAEMLERFDSPGRSAFVFRLSGRHVGPLTTPLGEVAPTGQQLTVLGMDIFTITDDRVTEVWAVADYLSLLMQTGAASLVGT